MACATTPSPASTDPGPAPDTSVLGRARAAAGTVTSLADGMEAARRRKAADYREAYVDSTLEDTRLEGTVVHAGIQDLFGILAASAVMLLVTMFVVNIIGDAIDVGNDSFLGEEITQIEGYIGDAFIIGAVALIVLGASVILFLISGFGGNGRNGGPPGM